MKNTVPAWLAAAAMCLPLLGLSGPLLEVDDARYAEVPRAMAASGDWVLPSLNGMPYVEKPPLWYWLCAASQKALGSSEAAARLPLLLLAMLGAGGIWWLGSWLYSPSVGRLASIATSTSVLWLFLSHNMTLDLPVSVFLLWTTAFILRILEHPSDARWAAPAAWFAAALAFLTKGLISVLFPVLWVIGLVVLFPKWRRPALKLISPLGIAAAVAVVVPWFYAVQARRPDFLHTFFVEQHFQRYLTPKYARGAPAWFYLAVLPAGLLPWTSPFVAGFFRSVRSPFSDPKAAALSAWVVGVIAFFSTSHSKLATYALPVVPHAMLLAAASLDSGLPKWSDALSRGLGSLLLLASVVAVAVSFRLPFLTLPFSVDASLLRDLLLLGGAFFGVLGAVQLFSPSSKKPFAVLSFGAVLSGMLAFAVLSKAAPLASAKELALAVKRDIRPEDQLWTYGFYLHGLQFYTGRQVDKMVYWVGELHYAKRDAIYADRFGDDNAVTALPRRGGRTFVAIRAKEWPHFQTLPKKGSITGKRDFGSWSLVEVSAAR